MTVDARPGPAVARDRRLEVLTPAVVEGTVVVDLRLLAWVDQIVLVGAAALASAARRAGRPFLLRRPAEPDVANYCARMRLGWMLDALGAGHDLPVVRERDLRKELLEVALLRDAGDVRRLAELVHGKVRPIDDRAAGALYQSLAEIGGNVPEHAGTVGFLAAQTLRRSGQICFAVADAGVGLLGTLASRGATSDEEAIDLALSGTSRIQEPGRGWGLPTTLDLVSDLGGQVYLASGTASVTATRSSRRPAGSAARFPGTLFGARVAIARWGRMAEIDTQPGGC